MWDQQARNAASRTTGVAGEPAVVKLDSKDSRANLQQKRHCLPPGNFSNRTFPGPMSWTVTGQRLLSVTGRGHVLQERERRSNVMQAG